MVHYRMLSRVFYFVACSVTYSSLPTNGIDSRLFEARKDLVTKLTNNSEITRQFLPVINNSHHIEVSINMTIQKIATVDEVNQALRLVVWLRLHWTNPFLTWDPVDNQNITTVHISNDNLWTPDITLYNKASLEEETSILYESLTTSVIVESSGLCKWLAPATLLSQCKIDVSKFPFDDQICNITFGSWTYAAHELDVVAGTASLQHFAPSGEWDILGAPMERNEDVYPAGTYPSVTLRLHIRRRPLYFSLNLIIPCTVISILSFLSFVLPTNHGERVSLVITVLLAMSVYMLIVSSNLPQTSDAMPVIGTYFLCIIVEIACCLLATCFVAKIRARETNMPRWLERLVNNYLARLCFVQPIVSEYSHPVETKGSHGNRLDTVDLSQADEKAGSSPKLTLHCESIDRIAREIAVLTDDVAIRQRKDIRSKKWQNAAKVLDRIFFIVFSLVFFILTTSVFARI